MVDKEFIKKVESEHFRTEHDTGATSGTLLIWNIVRKECGLPPLKMEDLPAYCSTHNKYHKIEPDYDCKRLSPLS